MRVLVTCEESQVVTMAFRAKGHEAYSNDIQECSGGHPEYHLLCDALEAIDSREWDLVIAHPPCTFLAAPGMHYLKTRPERMEKLLEAFEFVKAIWNRPIKKLALENPIGWLNTNWRKPNQIIQPYYFGDNEMKTTCLWLRGLPRLNGNIEVAMNPKLHRPKPDRIRKNGRGVYFCDRVSNTVNDWRTREHSKLKSKTFQGIANAMADQWG